VIDYSEEIKQIIQANGGEIKLDDSIKVKATPHTPMIRIITLLFTDNNICFETKDSTELVFLDECPEIVEATIYQRLRLMKYHKQLA
jgi:hypothetical protein